MQEIEKELGGIDGFFTMFGCHYVGMFSNPRMNVLFDTSHKNDANSNALDHGKRVASSLLDLQFGTTYFGSLGRSHHLARVVVQGSHMKVKLRHLNKVTQCALIIPRNYRIRASEEVV